MAYLEKRWNERAAKEGSCRCEFLEGRLLLASIAPQEVSTPVPSTSGPYVVGIFSSVQFDASSSADSDPAETLSFSWDLDGDSVYGEIGSAAANGDEIGAKPTFLANSTPAGVYPIKLRATNSSGVSSDLATSVTIRKETLIGTPGDDSLRISLNASNIVDFYENAAAGAPPTFSIPFNKVGFIRIIGGDGDDAFSMDFAFPMNLNLGAGNDTFILTGGVTWSEDGQTFENLIVSGTASIDFRRISYRFNSFTLSGSAKVSLTGTNTFLHLGSLSMSDSATLDLTYNELIVDSGDIIGISRLINSGRIVPTDSYELRQPGGWTPVRMAAIVNTDPIRTTFGGETNLRGGEVLIGLARRGDVNFDDQVSIADLIQLASHFNQSPASWGDGDITGDGIVSIADFIYLASWWGPSYSASSAAEPALSSAITPAAATKKHRRLKPRHHISPSQESPKFSHPRAHWLENR